MSLIFYYPKNIYWAPFILILFIGFAIAVLSGRRLNGDFWRLLIGPVIFIASAFLFVLFIDSFLIRWLVAALAAVFLGFFLENFFYYSYQPGRYQPYALENTANYFNLLSVFLFFSSAYSLIVFLDLSMTILAILILLVVGLLSYQVTWFYKIPLSKSWLYLLISLLLAIEFFWVVSFLPTSFYVNGLILAVVYYFILGLIYSHLLDKLDKRVIRRYALVSLGALVIILGTARWL